MQSLLLKYRKNIIFIAFVACVFLLLRSAGELIFPFIFAFAISLLVRWVAGKLSYVTGLGKNFGGVVCLFGVYLAAMALLFFGLRFAIKEISDFFSDFPNLYSRVIEPKFVKVADLVSNKMGDDYKMLFQKYSSQITNKIFEISGNVTSWFSEKLMDIPKVFFSIFVTMMASFFICFDYAGIKNFVSRQFTYKTKKYIVEAVNVIADTAKKMALCSAILSGITFIILLVAFILFGIEKPFVLSLALALFDALPMVGVGIVLVPWSIISFINSDYYFAVGILCIFFIIIMVHNILEPKILGKKIGIHPLLSLVAVYVGMMCGGVVTIFLLMFTFAIVKYLNENRILTLYK